MRTLALCCVAALVASGAAQQRAAPKRWTMTGRAVTAEDGTPLTGCTVTVDGLLATGGSLGWCWLDWCDPAPVVTGTDGRFAFSLPVIPGRSRTMATRLACG